MMKNRMAGPTRRTGLLLLIPALGACAGGSTPEAPGPEAVSPEAAMHQAVTTITAADMGARIGALADDSMRGRDTPSPELEKAAVYLSNEFRSLGLKPAGDDGTYIQRYDYKVSKLEPAATSVSVQGGASSGLEYGKDYFLVPSPQAAREGSPYYAGVAGAGVQIPAEARGGIIVFDHPVAELGQAWQQKLMSALQATMTSGAAGMIAILDPAFQADQVAMLASMTAQQRAPFPIVGITEEAARRLFAAAGVDIDAVRTAGVPAAMGNAVLEIRSAQSETTHRPPNVVAVLPGSDPALAGTYVVISAHFDHVGVGSPNEAGDSIYNGADDDASGTAAVLEIAEAFASLPKAPARSVLFLAVSGEEKGLLGSMAFAKNPTVPMDSVVADVNMDMIGRNARDTVIGIGQEYSSLADVLAEITGHHPELGLNVILDPKPEEMFFFRSDQLAFIKEGVPAVFFTTGEHPDYHKPSDDPASIDNDKAARVTRLGFLLAAHIAQDPERPAWTPEGKQKVDEMLARSPF